ncbi:MAG: hypothetical protein WCT04_20260 [Planctomycetota bacterium]
MRMVWMAVCVFMVAGCAAAATVDDVIARAQKGEPEANQIAAVDNTPGEISIGASDVLRLREAKVPEKVIIAMLRHVTKDAAAVAATPQRPAEARDPSERLSVRAPVAPLIPAAPPAQVAAPQAIRNPNQDGQITIENLDDRAWSYMYEPAIQTIWIAFPSEGSVVQAHSSTTLSIRSGNYKIRFSGTQSDGYPLAINGGERSAINVSRVNTDGNDTVNVSLYENGQRRASGVLVALANVPRETVVTQTYVESPVYYSVPTYRYYSTPYYYGPSYYSGSYYGPRYYGGGTQFNLGFNFGGGRGGRR